MSSSLTSQPSIPSMKIFSEDSLRILRVRGDNPQLLNGYRAISNASYSSAASLSSQATVLIPDDFESLETLKFLEFNDTTAEIVWNRYCRNVTEDPDMADLLESAKAHITYHPANPMWDNDDWIGAMQHMGLSSNFQARLMAEEFRDMRLSGSLKEWVINMIEMRSEFLVALDDIIKAPPHRNINRRVSKMDIDGSMTTLAGPEIPARSSSKTPKTGTFGSSSLATTAAKPPRFLDQHTMFYKGGEIHRLESIYAEAGGLNFAAIGSTPPNDFSRNVRGLCLTKHEQVAWRYAQWKCKLANNDVVPIGMLKVAVPNSLLGSIKELYGDEWSSLVWFSQRDQKIPQKLEYLADCQWLVGPICKNSSRQVMKLQNKSQLRLWKMDRNQMATQHFTGNLAMMKLLDEQCVGKIWITSVMPQGMRSEGALGEPSGEGKGKGKEKANR